MGIAIAEQCPASQNQNWKSHMLTMQIAREGPKMCKNEVGFMRANKRSILFDPKGHTLHPSD